MAILKTTLGYYIPTFFEMHVSTYDDDMVINRMTDRDATVLFHEYIHFLQDITTFYGLNNLYVQSEYFHSVVNRIKGNQQFHVPFMIEDNNDNVLLNQIVCKLTVGDYAEQEHYHVYSIDEMEEELIPNPFLKKIKSIVLNFDGDSLRSFGAIAIMESMAYILERLCSPNAYTTSPDYPYRAAELVAQYYDDLLAELKNRLKISIFLWRKKLCISLIFSNFVVFNYKVIYFTLCTTCMQIS